MTQARASLLQLATAMDFLREPDAYDAAASWDRACVDLGAERAEPLAVLARACADGPLVDPATLALNGLVDRLEHALDGPGWAAAAADVAGELRAARALPAVFAPPPPAGADAARDDLGHELAPWAAAAATEASAGLAALRLIQQVRPIRADGDGDGRILAPDPESAMHHAFIVTYTWMASRADEHTVYGPRFAVYSAVVQLPDGAGPALDVSASLRENANVIDRLCRLALNTYEAWRGAPGAAREPAAGPLPFRDRRIGES
jgi:hypothetical protein